MASTFDDFALALQLQEQFDKEIDDVYVSDVVSVASGSRVNPAPETQSNRGIAETSKRSQGSSLCDATWEVIDPSPDAWGLFIEFNKKFFWGKLTGVELRWSTRMTLCAGLCEYEGRGGLCCIKLSEPLLKFRPRKDLVETLLHEMIHAYLFVTSNNKDREGHGPEFLKHMHRLNAETGAKITVYHSFHDEVDVYRQHWWRCTGKCRDRQPYFGYVKRVMNRPPSARDPWFSDHERNCGGMFVKVKEPEGFGVKKSMSSAKNKAVVDKASPKNSLSSWRLSDKKESSGALSREKIEAIGKAAHVDFDDFGCFDSISDADLVGAVSELENSIHSESISDQKEMNIFPGKGRTVGTIASQMKSASPPHDRSPVRYLPGIGFVENRVASKNHGSVVNGQVCKLNGLCGEEKLVNRNSGFIELGTANIVPAQSRNTPTNLSSKAVVNRDSTISDDCGGKPGEVSGTALKRKVTVSEFRTKVFGNSLPQRGSVVYVTALKSVAARKNGKMSEKKSTFFEVSGSTGKLEVVRPGMKRLRDDSANLEDNESKAKRLSASENFGSKASNSEFQKVEVIHSVLVEKDIAQSVDSKFGNHSGFSSSVSSFTSKQPSPEAGVSGFASRKEIKTAEDSKLSNSQFQGSVGIRPASVSKGLPSRASGEVRTGVGSAVEVPGVRVGQSGSSQNVAREESSLVECPACQLRVDVLLINQHLDGCLIY